MAATSRRDSEEHGELGSLVGVEDCVQAYERSAAGDVRRASELRVQSSVSIYGKINEAERSGGCTRAREEGRYCRGAPACLV
jgi:hypothetical protein